MPCYKRCKEIEYIDNVEKVIETDDADGGWVDTHHYSNLVEHIEEMTLNAGGKEEKKEEKSESKSKPNENDSDGMANSNLAAHTNGHWFIEML